MSTVDVTDLNRLEVTLNQVGGSVGALAATAVRRTAAQIQATAQAFAPVDTGALRSSISSTVTGDGRNRSIEAEIGPTVDYGAHVEYGTSTQGPAAYMGPAFDRHAPDLPNVAAQIAARALEQ